MQYNTVSPFLLEYHEEGLQCNVIIEGAIAESILS